MNETDVLLYVIFALLSVIILLVGISIWVDIINLNKLFKPLITNIKELNNLLDAEILKMKNK
jgi:hypothetical protein